MLSHIHIDLNSDSINLIRYVDQLNRKIVMFSKTLSRLVLGILVILLAFPIVIAFLVVLALTSRFALEYLSFMAFRARKKVSKEDERALMEGLISLEKQFEMLSNIKEDLLSSNRKRTYYSIYFGGSMDRCLNRISKLKTTIETKVYPNLNEIPSQDKLRGILKAYQTPIILHQN